MKVLYFHQYFSTPEGAAGIRSYAMARALVESGVDVHLVCGSYGVGNTGLSGPYTGGKREGFVDGIWVTELSLGYSNKDSFLKRTGLFVAFALRSVVVALKTDAEIVFASSTPLTVALPGIAAKLLRRKTFVFEVRDLWPELPRAMGAIKNPVVLQAMAVLEKWAYRSADRVVALAPGIQDGIKEVAGSSKPTALVPNGCDVALFDSVAPDRFLPGVTDDDFLVVYSGTHGMANNLGAVLDVAAELQSRGVERIKIALIGDGMQKADLAARVSEEGLNNVLMFDPIPKKQLVALLKSADVGLQVLDNVPAFYRGTSPNKFFDYLSAGLAVVCNYPGWVSDIIDESHCGLAVDPENPSSFADALTRLAEDAGFTELCGANARKVAESQFNREELATSWREFVLSAHG